MQHRDRTDSRAELAAAERDAFEELWGREPAAGVVTVQADGHIVGGCDCDFPLVAHTCGQVVAELLPADDEGEDEDGYDEDVDIEDADVVDDQAVMQADTPGRELAVRDPFREWELRLAELRIEQRMHEAIAWEDKALELLNEGKAAELADHIEAGVDLIDPPVRRRRVPEIPVAADIAERYNVPAMLAGRFDDTAMNAVTAARAAAVDDHLVDRMRYQVAVINAGEERYPYLSALMSDDDVADIWGAADTH